MCLAIVVFSAIIAALSTLVFIGANAVAFSNGAMPYTMIPMVFIIVFFVTAFVLAFVAGSEIRNRHNII